MKYIQQIMTINCTMFFNSQQLKPTSTAHSM